MQSKLLHEAGGQRTFALIFDAGDEVMSTLTGFAEKSRITGASFTAIGAFSDALLQWFDWEARDYRDIPVREQVEVLVLAGDVAIKEDGQPKVHAHVVVGTSDGTARGGHLGEAHVRPTLELILTESPSHLRRKHDERSGLALIVADQ